MRLLSKSEIDALIFRSTTLTDREITAIFDLFQKEQPDLYECIYGEPSDDIAEINQDMSNLYLDLCFDIVFIYREAFGKPPKTKRGDKWATDALTLLEPELQSMLDAFDMAEPFRKRLQERFISRTLEFGFQYNLVGYVEDRLNAFASKGRGRTSAISRTRCLILVFMRLMDELYNRKKT